MMKMHYATNLAAAGLLVVPAVTVQNAPTGTLATSLERTLEALEELGGLERRVATKDYEAVREILRWTEPPIEGSDPAANDQLLEDLRGQVGRLRSELDVALSLSDPESLDAPDLGAIGRPETGTKPAVTTGLDDDARRMLVRGGGGPVNLPSASTKIDSGSGSKPAAQVEQPGYTADPVRLARAYYRKGLFRESLLALEGATSSSEVDYWKARNYEKLGRYAEAVVTFENVIKLAPDSYEAKRAKEDVEFLKWRIEFRDEDAAGKDTPR